MGTLNLLSNTQKRFLGNLNLDAPVKYSINVLSADNWSQLGLAVNSSG